MVAFSAFVRAGRFSSSSLVLSARITAAAFSAEATAAIFSGDDLHPLPVRVQLIRRNHRQRGANTRAHLRTMRHDIHRAVRLDARINARMQSRAGGLPVIFVRVGERRFRQNPRGQHQRAGRKHAAQKAAARDIFDVARVAHAISFAA
jgi:hypothetical protein